MTTFGDLWNGILIASLFFFSSVIPSVTIENSLSKSKFLLTSSNTMICVSVDTVWYAKLRSKLKLFPSITADFFILDTAFMNRPLPVPPSGLSVMTSSLMMTAGQ